MKELLRECLDIAERAPELNMSNYDHDEVSELNQAMTDITLKLRAALSAPAGLPEEPEVPTPEYTQRITFEGAECAVMAPEDYEALWNYARALRAIATKAAPSTNSADASSSVVVQKTAPQEIEGAHEQPGLARSGPPSSSGRPAPAGAAPVVSVPVELAMKCRIFIEEQAHWCEVAGGIADYQHQLVAELDSLLAAGEGK
jgi:hypothetical protein